MGAIQISNNNQIIITNKIDKSMIGSFIKFLDGVSLSSINTYSRSLKQMFDYFYLNGINQPNRNDMIAYREELKESHRPTTVQNYMTACRLFFRWAEQEGLYPNICDHLKGAKIEKIHKKDALTSDQAKELINSIDQSTEKGLRDYAIILLILSCGLRTVEVSRANIEDIRNVEENTVIFIQGKGKDERSEYVRMNKTAYKAIRKYLRTRGKTKPTDPLFASISNKNQNGRMTTRSISRIVKDHLISAGYESDRLTAHSLRHTAVTLSLRNGEKLENAQIFARHKDLSTTMIYNHAIDSASNTCSETIEKILFN